MFVQKFIKILSQIDSKIHHFFDRFLHGFLDGQEAAKTAKTAPRGRQDGPRGPQDGPKRVPKNLFPSLLVDLGRQDARRPPQDPSKIHFEPSFDPPLVLFFHLYSEGHKPPPPFFSTQGGIIQCRGRGRGKPLPEGRGDKGSTPP